MNSGKIKWIIIGLLVIGLFVFCQFAVKDVSMFFVFIGVMTVASLIIYGTSKSFGKTLLAFFAILFLFIFGMWLSQKVHTVLAKDNNEQTQTEIAVVDAQNVKEKKVKLESAQETNTCEFTDRYPDTVVRWCSLIEVEAAEHGIDPLLIASVIKHESNGQPQAGSTIQTINGVEYHTSYSGAVGLMQVMPSDGISAYVQCINGPCFAGRPTSAELIDPAYNIHYGTKMLAGLVNKWGSVRDGLMHYGPNPDSLYATYGNYYWYADLILSTYNSL